MYSQTKMKNDDQIGRSCKSNLVNMFTYNEWNEENLFQGLLEKSQHFILI